MSLCTTPAWAQALSTLYDNQATITIDESMVSGNASLFQFVVLVSLEGVEELKTTSNGGEIQDPNGYDIVFAKSPDAELSEILPHQLEYYDGSNGDLIIWVLIDLLSATVDTELTLFYGRVSPPNYNDNSLWNTAGYIGVWQLSETPDGSANIIDASGNISPGTSHNMDASNVVSSVVGKGYSFNGVDEYIAIPDDVQLEPSGSFTISCWFQAGSSQPQDYAKLFSKGRTGAPYASYTLEMRPKTEAPADASNFEAEVGFQTGRSNGNYVLTDSNNNGKDDVEPDGNWNYFAGVIDDDGGPSITQKLYLNGELISSSTEYSGSAIDFYTGGNYPLTIGGLVDGTTPFNLFQGIIDELRISNFVHNIDYIKTEVNNTSCSNRYMTISGFTTGVVTCNAATLPVEFIHLSAHRDNHQTRIEWTTGSEKNNDFFTVEKSWDNKHFEILGTVKGAGTSTAAHDYSYIDYSRNSGIVYYRIKQTDYDGQYEYSQLIKVTGAQQNGGELSIYPNPSPENTSLQLTLSGLKGNQVQLTLTNISGIQVLHEELQNLTTDRFTYELDTHHLRAGTYILSVVSQHQSFVNRVVIH
ncbi:hypothetical protein BFP72_11840 [Reichenbachiella sp. 5M10]|nr:hypothetical protein BFP72_11840 [Reichenbachiella sp. 5M10]